MSLTGLTKKGGGNMVLSFHEYTFFILRILLSGALGWLLGYERTKIRKKPVGARTFSLIALGSALFTVSALAMFEIDSAARIIASIIPGIGFIGAGVIWKDGANISGITTAALVWVTAGIGMAIGLGEYILGFAAFFVAMIIVINKSTDNFSGGAHQ